MRLFSATSATPAQIKFRAAFGQSVSVIIGLAALATLFPQDTRAQFDGQMAVDFEMNIKPILTRKCYACHGPDLRSGGVRLDQRSAVAEKGYSQRPLLGGNLQTNEIYRRVSSPDPSYRMPKGQPPLTPTEIDLLRRWVLSGTPWPMVPTAAANWRRKWIDPDAWAASAERWLNEVPGFVAWLCVMLLLQFGLLFVERYKQAVRAGDRWALRPWAQRCAVLQRVGIVHYLLVIAAMCLVLAYQIILGMRVRYQMLEKTLQTARGAVSGPALPTTFSIYGNPPVPIRPKHPPRLSGTYYRGNCERSPELFNGGNYRTATLNLALIDSTGRVIQPGMRVAPGSLAVRLELERAAGTTETLFGDSIPKGVFLTTQVLKDSLTPVTSPIEYMKTTRPAWKWEAIVPLKRPADEQDRSLSGMIYVYQGTVDGQQARGTVHYGIRYDLHLKDLTLQPGSDLWMGSLFWSANLEHPHATKVPLKEWFDEQPILEIQGENSKDPKLLGIPEHLEK